MKYIQVEGGTQPGQASLERRFIVTGIIDEEEDKTPK